MNVIVPDTLCKLSNYVLWQKVAHNMLVAITKFFSQIYDIGRLVICVICVVICVICLVICVICLVILDNFCEAASCNMSTLLFVTYICRS